MPDQDAPQEPDGPSLELPSLGFGRKKKRRGREESPTPEPEQVEPTSAATAPAEPTPAPAPPPPQQQVQEPRAEPVPERVPQPAAPRGAPLFTDETATAPQPPVDHDDPEDDDAAPPARRTLPRPVLPTLGPLTATLVTGLLVGVIVVGLVWASQGLCEVVRGTSTCGNLGFLVLLAVLVVAGLVGGALLTALGVGDGGSTSFLAMGLVAVVLMLVLADHLFAWWMVLVVPVVAMGAYALSHRLTTTMVDTGGPEMHR